MSGKRTPEQQAAYNEQRRGLNATRKAEAERVLAEAQAKVEAKRAAKAKAKAKKVAMPAKKLFAEKTATAKHIKGVDPEPTRVGARTPWPAVVDAISKKADAVGIAVMKRKAAPLRIQSQPTPAPASVDKSTLTNARSYRKAFKGAGATQRGKMMQVTVTFTADQFGILRSAAEFRQCSIAETIRASVLREHGTALQPST